MDTRGVFFMEWKDYFYSVLKGVIGAVAITILLTAIFSLLMTFVEFSSSALSGIYVVITSIGLIFGSILSAKLHGHKGWLVGLSVGLFFYIALYAIGVLFGAEAVLGMYDLIKFSLCLVVGLLSGMLGINLGKE
jgi:putative membrane protein (TIGR04086 family)